MSEMYDNQNNQSVKQIKQQIHATVIIPQEEYWGKVTGQEIFIESTSVYSLDHCLNFLLNFADLNQSLVSCFTQT